MIWKIDKYEYLTGWKTLPSDRSKIIEQTKFAYSSLGKDFEKQTKKIEEQEKKQVQIKIKLIEGFFPK